MDHICCRWRRKSTVDSQAPISGISWSNTKIIATSKRTRLLPLNKEDSMKREIRFVQLACGLAAILLVAMAGAGMAQNGGKPKKFLTKPLLIEDQGSFFIGGVPKVTNYATVAPPNAPPNQTNLPNQITIGQMYVQFQIPARKK